MVPEGCLDTPVLQAALRLPVKAGVLSAQAARVAGA
jgi:hypothetical protein